MRWFIGKGASLGFCITTALLAAILLCALFVSCGHKNQSGVWSRESGVKDKNGSTSARVFDSGLKTQDSGLSLADILAQIDAYPVPKGVDATRFASLKAELKRLLVLRSASGDAGSTTSTVGVDLRVDPATKRADTQVRPYEEMGASAPADSGAGGPARQSSQAKTLSLAPVGTMNAVTDLAATVSTDGSLATLTWTEALPGDYDNNGVVDIGDLIPLALYYGQRTDSDPDDAHRLVNGDFNPEINIWDLGAIAGNYGAHIQGYQVWRGHWNGSSIDWETSFLPNRSDPEQTSFSVDRPSPPPPSRRPSYWYGDIIYNDTDKNNIRYKVVPYGDGAPGAESNEAAVPATTFSVSGKVTLLGAGLEGATLALAPGGLHATTQADGSYAISGLANGSYSLTPTAIGYVFAPKSIPATVNGANVVGLDFAASGGLANSAWPKFHGNAQNTGQSPYIGAQTNHVKWTSAVGWMSRLYSSPVVGADGTVYIGASDFKVYALNPADGSVKWTHATGGCVYGSPAIGADGTIYVGSEDFNVYALNPLDGSVKWAHPTDNKVRSSPAIGADGTVYVGSMDNKVYALNPSDGSVKWTYATGAWVYSSPAIGPEGTVYVGSYDWNVYALNPSDGSVKWAYATGSGVYSSPAVGADGTVYIGSWDHNVYALNPSDGSVKWAYATGSGVYSSPAVAADGTVYIGSYDRSVYALNPADGSLKWSHYVGNCDDTAPAIGADGTVYFNTAPYPYALNPSDGNIKWECTSGGEWCSPAMGADGTVYIGSRYGKLYAFGP